MAGPALTPTPVSRASARSTVRAWRGLIVPTLTPCCPPSRDLGNPWPGAESSSGR
ncbi:DUF3649 domain-containing protein [Nonomuraea sp. NPDC023979]|uniref:DUF3649 domain-containing protein n=1 Tax=Nonomuraea sp. NPDC023979 TaxID=3154796 RepID=UPI0033C13FFC